MHTNNNSTEHLNALKLDIYNRSVFY